MSEARRMRDVSLCAGGASEVCLTRHAQDHGHAGGDGGGGGSATPHPQHSQQMAFFHPTQQSTAAPAALATPQMSAPSQMPRVQAKPREEILGCGAGGAGPSQTHAADAGKYSPLSPPQRRVVSRTYLNGGSAGAGQPGGAVGDNGNGQAGSSESGAAGGGSSSSQQLLAAEQREA